MILLKLQHHFTGRIALVCGDNLAANKLAGFTHKFYTWQNMPLLYGYT